MKSYCAKDRQLKRLKYEVFVGEVVELSLRGAVGVDSGRLQPRLVLCRC